MKRKILLTGLLAIASLSALGGCKRFGGSPDARDAALSSLTTESTTNVALLIAAPQLGSPDELQGPLADLETLKSALSLRGDPYGFGPNIEALPQARLATIVDAATAAAAKARGGTLLISFSGHGAPDGQLFDERGEKFYLTHIVNAIRARSIRLKRLIFIVDACYAGNLVDGATGARLIDFGEETFGGGIFGAGLETGPTETSSIADQTLVFAAALKGQQSGDGPNGGVFTRAFKRTLEKVVEDGANPTLAEFFAALKSDVRGQEPAALAIPADLLGKERLLRALRPDEAPPPPWVPKSSTSTQETGPGSQDDPLQRLNAPPSRF